MAISRRLRFLLAASISGLLVATAPAQVPTFSLKAVKRNPTCTAGLVGEVCGGDRQCDSAPLIFDGQCGGEITPTNTVSANPGDIIVAEIYASNWSPDGQRLQAFQVTIDEEGFTSECGTILPYGWNAPPQDIKCAGDADCPTGMWCDTAAGECKPKSCTSDLDCPPQFPKCHITQLCIGADHDPQKGAFVDEFRLDELDWVFQDCSVVGRIDPAAFGYRFGYVIADSLFCAPTYTEPKYFGTLMLVVSKDAGGTYTIPLMPPPDTIMVDTNGLFLEALKIEDLTIEVAKPPEPTFSLKAVRKNPECVGGADAGGLCTRDEDCDSHECAGAISPSDHITAYPGDIIVAEVYASDWSPKGERLREWRATIDSKGLHSGLSGELGPLEFKSHCPFAPCLWDAECAGMFGPGHVCGYDGCCHLYYLGPGIDCERSDYVFAGTDACGSVTRPPAYEFTARTAIDSAPAYSPPPKYCGTMVLAVSSYACGTFTIPFYADRTFMTDATGADLRLATESLVVDIPEWCLHSRMIWSTPPDCAVDARQVSEPDGSTEREWDSIELDFLGHTACDLTLADFRIRHVPADSPAVSIADLECKSPRKLVLNFDGPMPTQAWTCVSHIGSATEVCVGRLPGDADGNRVSDAADVLYLIDCLNGVAPCKMYQCDIDRSGRCGPADILREIDLLNGAAAYDTWLGRTLPECPSLQ